ncbi:hypothetical protein F7Q99_37485 [Streptomyces kaniharaensis]|uniref:Uncharacterized protein n=1 Tax=Streptomyces kaniharaensis TaxID=212423 RepID=A0A6N7L1M1_9ACTN|nr:PD40 domain-containing protein [Streptomyces kaniharaensis]MQS17732.1 hypothetical protein [Streptomyces kaniharaensis]
MRIRTLIAASATAVVLVAGCSSSGSDDGPDPDENRPTGAGSTGGSQAGERRADGAELLYRADGRRSAQNPAFAPDGGSMLMTEFTEGYNKGPAALGVLPLEGDRKPRKVLEDPDKAAVNLPGTSWNAAAGAFTFATDRDSAHDEVWTMKPGGSPERVTSHDDNSGFNEPSFSPDGEWIVFQQSWEPEHASVHGDGAEQDSISPGGESNPASLWRIPAPGL